MRLGDRNIVFEIHTKKIDPNKNDSVWYYGDHICTITLPTGAKYIIESRGALTLLMDDKCYEGNDAVHQLSVMGCDDAKVEDMFQGGMFDESNWLEMRMIGTDDYEYEFAHGLDGGYSQAIDTLIEELINTIKFKRVKTSHYCGKVNGVEFNVFKHPVRKDWCYNVGGNSYEDYSLYKKQAIKKSIKQILWKQKLLTA